jgi:hypothetical protein
MVSLLIAGIIAEWSFRAWAAFLAFAQMVNIIVFAWMAIGNWRAAGAHMRRTRRRFWPLMARGILIAHAVVLAIVVIPKLSLNFQIGAGVDSFGTFEIVRTAPRELLFQGELVDNVPGEVSAALRAAPEIEWIRLESTGGWVGTARELANMISANGIKTRVWDECSSVCFLAFMSADVRAISPRARIGLHAYLMPSGMGILADSEMDNDRQFFIHRGVSEEFLDKAFATPPDDMWYPSFEELIEAGVVTHVMEDGEIRPVHPE